MDCWSFHELRRPLRDTGWDRASFKDRYSSPLTIHLEWSYTERGPIPIRVREVSSGTSRYPRILSSEPIPHL